MKYLKTLGKIIFWMIAAYLCLNLIIIFIFSHPTYTDVTPEKGIWYCEQLQIQLSCEDDNTYAVVNGKMIRCVWGNDRYSNVIGVECQESGIEEYRLGETVFWGYFVSLTDSEYVIRDAKSGVEYTFDRIDSIS